MLMSSITATYNFGSMPSTDMTQSASTPAQACLSDSAVSHTIILIEFESFDQESTHHRITKVSGICEENFPIQHDQTPKHGVMGYSELCCSRSKDQILNVTPVSRYKLPHQVSGF